MALYFEWDRRKAESNIVKHGVSFELAQRVFADPYALTVQDRIENGEYRWQTLGKIAGELVLLVAHTIIDNNGEEIIRIISARKATAKEKRKYEQHYAFSY